MPACPQQRELPHHQLSVAERSPPWPSSWPPPAPTTPAYSASSLVLTPNPRPLPNQSSVRPRPLSHGQPAGSWSHPRPNARGDAATVRPPQRPQWQQGHPTCDKIPRRTQTTGPTHGHVAHMATCASPLVPDHSLTNTHPHSPPSHAQLRPNAVWRPRMQGTQAASQEACRHTKECQGTLRQFACPVNAAVSFHAVTANTRSACRYGERTRPTTVRLARGAANEAAGCGAPWHATLHREAWMGRCGSQKPLHVAC